MPYCPPSFDGLLKWFPWTTKKGCNAGCGVLRFLRGGYDSDNPSRSRSAASGRGDVSVQQPAGVGRPTGSLDQPSSRTYDSLHRLHSETAAGGLPSGGSPEHSSLNLEPVTAQLERESHQRLETETFRASLSLIGCHWEISSRSTRRPLPA